MSNKRPQDMKLSKLFHYTTLFLRGIFSLIFGANLEFPFLGNSYIFSDTLSILWGCLLGPLWGAIIVGSYLITGILGLPVFAENSGGIDTMTGPSGGYLIGFLLASVVSGFWYKSQKDWRKFLALPLGQIIIYGSGLIGLLLTTDMTGMESLQAGVIDFLPGATLKLIAAGLLLELLEWYKERRRGKFQYFK